MNSLLAKKFYCLTPTSLHFHYLSRFPSLLSLSLSTQSHQSKEEEIPFIAQYLISSFGFSRDRALNFSAPRYLGGIKAPDRPEKVVSFLKEIGLSDSQVRSAISSKPTLLRYKVDKILKPRAHALIDAGFSGNVLIQLIQNNPTCLTSKGTLSRLQFWKKFVGYNDDTLLKVVQPSGFLLQADISKQIIPKLNILKEYGLSQEQIVKLITMSRWMLYNDLDALKWALKKTEEVGILLESNMFLHVLRTLAGLKKETLEKRIAFFKTMYAWSEKDCYSALRIAPCIFGIAEVTIKTKMDFLIKNAGFEPRSIASQPILLAYSLDSRLIPRHNVLSALQANGLIRKISLLNACVLSEKRFRGRFVVPYEKIVPELGESYAACAGNG